MRLYQQLHEAIQVFLAGWPNLQTPKGETVAPVHLRYVNLSAECPPF